MESSRLRQIVTREFALLVGLLFLGFGLMPIVIYQVGQAVFGDYHGGGYADFFGSLSARVRQGDPVAWFLILSPWLGWQCLRLLGLAWRASGKPAD